PRSEDPALALTGAEAAFLACLSFEPLHAAVLALLVDDLAATRVRLLHHACDAGHLVALGLAGAAVAQIWRRFATRGLWAAAGSLAAVGFVFDAAFLTEDLVPRALRMSGGGHVTPWLVGMLAIAAVTFPLAWGVGRALRRPPFVAPPSSRCRWWSAGSSSAPTTSCSSGTTRACTCTCSRSRRCWWRRP
ncbi:MAG: hypothetical protein RIF41_31355, partial [Polyangiaceae bacterium]